MHHIIMQQIILNMKKERAKGNLSETGPEISNKHKIKFSSTPTTIITAITIAKPRATFAWKNESCASDTCMLSRCDVG